jgi:signal transduction histidine kinase
MLAEIVEGIVSGTNRLHEVVNNMLDIQRIDMKQIKLSKAPVSLAVILRGIDKTLQESFAERHINFILDLGDNTDPIYVEADSGLLHKAIQQIVLNAVKYTPDGGSIQVTLRYEEHDFLATVAHITIQDTGIGIDPEHHKLIFEKFYRLGAAETHSSGKTAYKAGGPGLGLAISHGAILAHGGQIWVESAGYNEETFPGSTFHIVLPTKARIPSQASSFERMDRD